MRLPRRLSALLVVGALTALVAGCGSEAPAEPQAAPSPVRAQPVSLVRAAAAATDAKGTARYVLSTSTRVADQDVVLSGEGVIDWKNRKGRTTFVIPAGAVEQRLLVDDLFFVLPQQEGIFFRIPTAEVVATPVGGTVEPTAQLHALAAATEAEVVGEEEVRGERTTHYRGSFDVARALELAQGPQRAALQSSLGAASGLATLPFDAYLDEGGLLRRLTSTVEVPASPATGGQPLTVTTALELYEFGVKVYVPGPPGDMIRDGGPLLAALRTALPAAVVPPAPAAPAAPAAPPAPAPAAPAAPPAPAPAAPLAPAAPAPATG